MSTQQSQERGGCLTAWLIFMLAANAFTVASYFLGSGTLGQSFPSASPLIFVILATLGAVNLVSVYALWTWKRWGFYLFIVTGLIALVINLSLGLPIISVTFGLVGVGILWLLLRNRWQFFT